MIFYIKNIRVQNTKKNVLGKSKQWFVSASSEDSSGNLLVKIYHNDMEHNRSSESVSNVTSRNYVEVSGKWND